MNSRVARSWNWVGLRNLPIAEAHVGITLRRLLRLSMFQVSVGMVLALVIGTLNRVMIVELGVPARLVGLMVALPLLLAPFRAVIGFRSDNHVSVLGWRRVPYLWIGTMLQFGGLAIMPFALLLLSQGTPSTALVGEIGAAFAFLLVGAGMHTTQTVGLALATDIVPARSRPLVVALLCVMLLVGVLVSALVFGALLAHFSEERLIQVVQGAATVTVGLNAVALWKQEPRSTSQITPGKVAPRMRDAWRAMRREPDLRRRLVAVGLGTVAFSLQDVLLEPYGGQVLHLRVGATTALTALLAVGGLCGFAMAARLLLRGMDRYRVAAFGALAGLPAFAAVILSAPLQSAALFAAGTTLVGLGAALFLAGTLSGAMDAARDGSHGLALGTWGAVQSFAAGAAIALGAGLRDFVGSLARTGMFGSGLAPDTAGYDAVYVFEIALLFLTLAALGPLVRFRLPAAATLYPSKQEISRC
ncbi:BCD family MFS transporter [Lichenicoccus roseus]|uniref:BCD family MFS transporter n=1 Tax=Lichenicoccus roseus TaxID=2683649 RepID=A0A5R9JAP6_9PROT|nr:BCD family MFS transporter [Lichenicoccus roseus]TLU74069.1 BCD family MFS transporter [Lichenicoccus roseus]